MKLVKMSLAAAVLLGASAFALDNVKVSGDAKLFYGTDDSGTESLFDKDNSYADTALRIGATGDLLKGVSFGVTGYAVSTLGLENNLVSGVWNGAHTLDPNGSKFTYNVEDQSWLGEAWLAASMGKTTVKIGRMELDTPLAFSEKWNIAPNTFEGAVVLNQDIPDTTLVGAWVGKGNGGAGVVGATGKFNTFVSDGAYVAAIVNNSFKPLTAQAWYYNVVNVADAFWLQADINCQLVPGVKIGGQYASMSPASGADDSSAYAVKLGYAKDALSVSAAYSSVDDEGSLKIQNVATDLQGAAQSKLYTESWWTYGVVGDIDSKSWNLTAEYDMKNVAKLGAYYTSTENDLYDYDMDEVALTATKSFGPLDATLAYINTDMSGDDSYNTIQAYLTLNF